MTTTQDFYKHLGMFDADTPVQLDLLEPVIPVTTAQSVPEYTTAQIAKALGGIWRRCSDKYFIPAILIADAEGRTWIRAMTGRYFEAHPDPKMWHLVRLYPKLASRISGVHAARYLYNDPKFAAKMWPDVLSGVYHE